MRRSTLYPFGLLVALLMSLPAAFATAQGASAHLDRSSIYAGETVTLSLEAQGLQPDNQPDLSALESDFRVLGSSAGTRVSIVNGRRSDSATWQVTLAPLRSGTLEIPAITVGGASTRPISLEVRELPPEVARQRAESLFLETELGGDGGPVQVQQQVPLIARLYSAQPLREGRLSDPESPDAAVERLGEDRVYNTERNGRRYQVVERHYALFPQRSGELTIPPLTFRGSVRSQAPAPGRRGGGTLIDEFFNDPVLDRLFQAGPGGMGDLFSDPFFSRDPFAGFGILDRGTPVATQSGSIKVQVEPRPDGMAAEHWLPAEQVRVHDSWTESPPEWHAGEPVTRVITLEAVGLAGSQIPELQPQVPAGMRIYPGRPQPKSHTDGDRVLGTSRQEFTYIASRPGDLEVPALTVDWWDTRSGEARQEVVPSWQFQVAPDQAAAGAARPAAPAPVDQLATSQPATGVAPADKPGGWQAEGWDLRRLGFWAAGALPAILLFGLLLRRWRQRAATLVIGRRTGSAEGATRDTMAAPTVDAAAARRELATACRTGDPAVAARALLVWAAAVWPQKAPTNLAAVASRLAQGGDEVLALEKALYGLPGSEWNGEALGTLAAKGLLRPRTTAGAAGDSPLAPLYPQRA